MLPASLAAKWLPEDFVQSTRTGGSFTMAAYGTMLILFVLELRSYFDRDQVSSFQLQLEQGPQLQINFDIDMYDIECRNLDVKVIDEQREDIVRTIGKEYQLTSLDNRGRHKGIFATRSGSDPDADEEEWVTHERTAKRLEKEDGRKELDADWASSSDGLKHDHFDHVVQFHDFTLVNFFAEWCSHCRQFAPRWKEIADKVHGRHFPDREGNQREVWPVKMNCVDFKNLCREKGIDAFPTIRLYKSDGSFSLFEGDRSEAAIIRWIELVIKTKSYGWKKHHEEFEGGCNVRGYLRIPRVPGHLEFFAGGGDQNLEPTMTNVSHKVKYLFFSEPRDAVVSGGYRKAAFPDQAVDMGANPLEDKEFVTHRFHEAYEHHMQVVSIASKAGIWYQFKHYGRTAHLNETVVPQARFYFDLEPFVVEVGFESKMWYSFVTSLMAILGGVFVLFRLASHTTVAVGSSVTRQLAPRQSSSRATSNGLTFVD